MLAGMERLVDLIGPRESGLTGAPLSDVEDALRTNDADRLEATDGHFSATIRDGQTVRMARTIGQPLRYFVAKRYHGPYLVVADRIDALYEYCCREKIGWQFDPQYTRMIPAHYVVELDQVGCPDPNPRYQRFFTPEVGKGPNDPKELGASYVGAAYRSVENWIARVPDGQQIAVLFSGGVDSGSVLLLARHALRKLGRDPDLARAFTLDLGGGEDAAQAERWVRELGLESSWERISRPTVIPDLEEAISIIEDYHPLDVECAAASIVLLKAVRERYPDLKYLLDGDGGDENLKAYPMEDSDLTLSSILKNPLLYQEGWGVDAIKHSQCYSGGLSRSYARTGAAPGLLGLQPVHDAVGDRRGGVHPIRGAAPGERRAAVRAQVAGRPRGRRGRHRDPHARLPQAAVPGRRRRRLVPPVEGQQIMVPPGLPPPVGGTAPDRLGPVRRARLRQRRPRLIDRLQLLTAEAT